MRNLNSAEIEQLKANGNRCGDWSLISVVDSFGCDKVVGNQGMILSAKDRDGRLVLITPSQIVTSGCSVG